jgi:hypothetical protein
LGVSPDEQLRYRHVALSEADNWYVPSRLTPEMNHQLETSDIPFGRVIKPLGVTRRTLAAVILWHASANPHRHPLPAHLLRHRAVLVMRQGLAVAEVVETYTRAILDERGAK